MQAARMNTDGESRTFAVVFDTDDNVLDGLLGFARDEGINAASFTAIGAFRRATLGFFDPERKEYLEIPVDEQVEVLALTGNIGVHGGETKLHAHVVLGTRHGVARGGHLLAATVRPTLEVIVEESRSVLRRRIDDATGLPLIDLSAKRTRRSAAG
ncbi:MAG: PPC domain-containing DNA-binding protein [Gemmatimonadales bacterium]